MDVKAIRESGLLELYLMGACDESDKKIVEQALEQYPELQQDLAEISEALEQYGALHGIQPGEKLKDAIMQEAKRSNQSYSSDPDLKVATDRRSGVLRTLSILGSLGTLLFGLLYFNAQNENREFQKEFEEYKLLCDSLEEASQLEYAFIDDLQHPSNRILPFTSTGTFANVAFYMIYNEELQKNFLQIDRLPPITPQQSYQLWSLKPDQAPIPLNVFQGDEGLIIPVDFEDGTATYALTIEPRGGQESPTLSNLIGTVNV